MDKSDVIKYLNRISKDRGYGKCLITRFERILSEFPTLKDFTDADATKWVSALADWNQHHNDSQVVIRKEPFVGKKLLQVCNDARAYIINGRLKEKKTKEAEIRRQNFEVLVERKRNLVFTIKALKSVIALAELAGADTVNLDKIFEVCDAFGVSLDDKPLDTNTLTLPIPGQTCCV